MSTVITVNNINYNINLNEALRYMGATKADDALQTLLQDAVNEVKNAANPLGCYIRLPIEIVGNSVNFGFAAAKSSALSKNLKDCSEAFIFAATIGTKIDLIINRSLLTSPALAVALDAVGSAATEGVANSINSFLQSKVSKTLRPRFSPGYGDLDLSFQKQIISLLDTHRKIGLSITDGLMLTPTKSITAIIGIPNQEIGL